MTDINDVDSLFFFSLIYSFLYFMPEWKLDTIRRVDVNQVGAVLTYDSLSLMYHHAKLHKHNNDVKY